MNQVELIDLSPRQEQQSVKHSDSEDSLEPPFEVHGIAKAQPAINESLSFSQFQTAIPMPERPVSIEDFPESDSDDQAPPSMLFEQRPLLDQNPGPAQQVPPRIRDFPLRRRTTRYEPETKIIESWADVQHLDEFLTRIYDFYKGKGLLCIVIEQITDLLTVAFVVSLSIFLSECVDYSKISSTKKLQDVLVDQCVWK
jgi:hypothetical protein